MARADGEEVDFNVEKVFNFMMAGLEQVGLGAISEWHSLWRKVLTQSLKWKASGVIQRSALDETMDLFGEYSLTEATTQQIRSVYSAKGSLVAEVLLDRAPPGPSSVWASPVPNMEQAEFDLYDVYQLSQQTKVSSSRRCGKCSLPLEYGSDLCLNCGEFIKGTVV